jgi:hypothetical protein
MKRASFPLIGLLLTALSALASDTQIQGGQLWVDGEWQADSAAVSAPATLGGSGTVRSPQTVVAGTLAPGAVPGAVGTLTLTGDLSFQPGGKYDCDVGGDTSVDRAVVRGASTGSGEVRLSNPGGSAPVDQVIVDAVGVSDYAGFSTGGPDAADWGLRELPIEDLTLTHLTADTDHDGLPDWWELAYFSSRTAADPAAHGDDDEVPNGQEYPAGTDPTNGTSYLRITQLCEVADGKLCVTWPSVGSRWLNVAAPLYELSASAHLVTGEYAVVAGNLPSTPPDNAYTNPPTGVFSAWRVRRQ